MQTLKKKIRIVIGGLSVGGAERHLTYVLPELQKRGWHVELLTLTNQSSVLSGVLKKSGVTVKQPTFKSSPLLTYKFIGAFYKLLTAFFFLYSNFSREKNVLTHFFLPEAYGIGMVAAKLARVSSPLLMSRRCLNHYKKRRPVLGRMESLLHPFLTLALGNSKAIAKQLEEEGIPSQKIELIYNGIPIPKKKDNLNETYQDIKKNLSIGDDAIVIAIIANLIPYKGYSDLLNGLSQFTKKYKKEWVFISIGRDDGIGSDLQKQAETLGINQYIRWLNYQENPEYFLNIADIFVLSSHEEGFSNAILEAMSSGLPAVVTDVGGNAEAVQHQKNGLVIPAKSPELLAKALLELANSEEKRNRFSKMSRQRVEERFSLKRCIDDYENVYNKLLKG